MKTAATQHLDVLTTVWFEGKLWRISSRRGGVYQLEREGEQTRIAQRKNLKRYVKGSQVTSVS